MFKLMRPILKRVHDWVQMIKFYKICDIWIAYQYFEVQSFSLKRYFINSPMKLFLLLKPNDIMDKQDCFITEIHLNVLVPIKYINQQLQHSYSMWEFRVFVKN